MELCNFGGTSLLGQASCITFGSLGAKPTESKRNGLYTGSREMSKMAPLVVNDVGPQLNYKPVMGDQHGALFVADA